MRCECSYLELAGVFRQVLRETGRVEDALRTFDAHRVRTLALSAAYLGDDLAHARALLAHILVVGGWPAERVAEVLAEDVSAVRDATDAVTNHPPLMTIARLALESASCRACGACPDGR